MDLFYALLKILIVIALAFLLGWSQKTKNPLSPFTKIVIWIGSIVFLLALEAGFTKTWEYGLLLLGAGLGMLDHIPHWIGLIVAAVIVGYYIRFIITAFAQGIDAIALEQQKINARIELLENSLGAKLDDIASRLPEKDEPEYLKELRKDAFRN